MELLLFLLALSAYLLWISWSFHVLSFFLFIVSISLSLLLLLKKSFPILKKYPIFTCIAFVILISHAVGVFLPEVGFDALWYHLPITKTFVETHKTVFDVHLYQSAMPRLGSYLFVLPYMVLGTFGVKIFTYILGLLLFFQVFRLSRVFLSQKDSFILLLVFMSFHTISWQMSSAYVDMLRTLFEVSCVLFLFKKNRLRYALYAGVFMGIALSVKTLTLFFLPIYLLFILYKYGHTYTIVFCISSLMVVMPMYIQSYLWTGNFLYPLFEKLNGSEQMLGEGYSSLKDWVLSRVIRLPTLPFMMSISSESYTTPLFMFSIPFMFLKAKTLHKDIASLLLFTVALFIMWFFIPPLSVRYILTGFVLFLILSFYVVKDIQKKHIFYAMCFVGICINMIIRFGTHVSSRDYLLGRQTEQSYIQKYDVGISKGPIEHWYEKYYKNK